MRTITKAICMCKLFLHINQYKHVQSHQNNSESKFYLAFMQILIRSILPKMST